MTPYLKTLPLLLVLAACGDGQPFFNDEMEEVEDAVDGGEVDDPVVPGDENGEEQDGFDTTGVLPPDTQNPSPDR
ncbi:MAG: hypothetical protein LC676_17150, partial [Loktanella sp.]|nr:hypothetical protein [Loktanella sp.]